MRNIPETAAIRLSDKEAEKHQETLSAESEPGRASTFTVGLTALRQERSSL